jgi:dTDP-4-dehydrorhamnose reductase
MLGSAMLRFLAEHTDHDVVGTVRSDRAAALFVPDLASRLISGVNVEDVDVLIGTFARAAPTIVINCIGLVKQLGEAKDPLAAIPLNAALPHRLERLCATTNARLIHFSTDCVFSGAMGGYVEGDFPDADDVYGRTKLLGEVSGPQSITLRTSIIGRELAGKRSLIDWFLSQEGAVSGYRSAIFSGLPTVEIARVVAEHVIPNPQLHGLYHLSAEPIDKFRLLGLVAQAYDKSIEIRPDDTLAIDRSLNSDRFRQSFGYRPPEWPELIRRMRDFN